MLNLMTIYKLLSDETRLRILVLLYLDELCVCQLSGITDSPQPRISKNLSKLRDLDLVQDVRREKYVYYSLNKNNSLLMMNLDFIIEHKENYPNINMDIHKINTKNHYIDLNKE